MANEVNLKAAIAATMIIMKNMKAYGLTDPVMLDTYAYYANRLENLLIDELSTEPTHDTINKICFARGEYFGAMKQLKTYHT